MRGRAEGQVQDPYAQSGATSAYKMGPDRTLRKCVMDGMAVTGESSIELETRTAVSWTPPPQNGYHRDQSHEAGFRRWCVIRFWDA